MLSARDPGASCSRPQHPTKRRAGRYRLRRRPRHHRRWRRKTIAWFENQGHHSGIFKEHAIGIVEHWSLDSTWLTPTSTQTESSTLSPLQIWDWSGYNNLRILTAHGSSQDRDVDPDSITGIINVDINTDGRIDVFAGSYSRGSRISEKNVSVHEPLGRLWRKQRRENI